MYGPEEEKNMFQPGFSLALDENTPTTVKLKVRIYFARLVGLFTRGDVRAREQWKLKLISTLARRCSCGRRTYFHGACTGLEEKMLMSENSALRAAN